MAEPSLDLPDGVELVEGPRGPLFRGVDHLVMRAALSLRELWHQPDGYAVRLGPRRLLVTESATVDDDTLGLPPLGWNVLASMLAEAVEDDEPMPYYWSMGGPFDIGVDVTGNAFDDWPSYDPVADHH